MALADRIKAFRMRKKLSLQELADSAGVSKAHIWDLETGRSKNPSMDLLIKLANKLEVAVVDLVGENPDAEGEGSRVLGMYRELKNLSDRDLDVINSMIERLKSKDS
ncbi:MAG: helix-turn-helix transcriptional regulator [Mesorhizobium sp.]|uniref:helix-turn-helix domain-containing protein n=1 Tax=Mesorhizobium sp. TaxID=1871066 RepID=UPI000FE6AFF6|nr:helix-turn-helix transcriptional regulator [Mesorhizobium sp.]RWM50342.1 MAG: XRE family transcriptional regulator [Mesorhizobium sp.]TIQ34032.1 MAG: helix-turn-helix transcriptional regulator [Mesorhizobium sp.]